MEEPLNQLTIFYTFGIAGDLALLPRLHAFMQTLRQRHTAPVMLLDLGESCAASSWTCEATGGRSVFVVLDGMGYHAANATALTARSRDKLTAQVTLGLVDSSRAWRANQAPFNDGGIIASLQPTPAHTLCIQMQPAAKTALNDHLLTLAPLEKGSVGVVEVALFPSPHMTQTAVHSLPPDVRPDASISAAVEFVEDEARFYLRNRD